MTSELWIGIFIGGGIAMAIFFLIALMWAITARSSQISQEEEKTEWKKMKDKITNDIVMNGEAVVEMIDLDPRVEAYFEVCKKVFYDLNLNREEESYTRPEPTPPDHDVKSS